MGEPNDSDGPGSGGPRHSPLTVFHAVMFVMGGGLWLLWSPWGALLAVITVAAGYVVVRAMLSPSNVAHTQASIESAISGLNDLRALVEDPQPSTDAQPHALEMLRDRGLLTSKEYEARRAQIDRGGPQPGPSTG